MKLTSLRIDIDDLEAAKVKAEEEGLNLSQIIRKMIKNWLAGKYDPFRD